MDDSGLIDWKYYGLVSFIFTVGLGFLYIGSRVFSDETLMNIGLRTILLSVILFFGRSMYYLVEKPDPELYGR